ncbi:hypothetical protein DC366_09370 [Pelagivirga sediminicola]|uniref:Uncharacterized protein n=1 Tax=Pelagivirga sediminicola TaxID=2170575 RepID=A0A2T7G7R8_9RHOB|nr:hypothetical protein [Pelagivirga sediminicola]PVA10427.1 hypothetical protein DC366_09370 [Pelagivirga sediminicola]
MGPLRRGLIAATAALPPGAALAGTCDTVRPGWDGVPVTIWGEAAALFSTPAALFLLAASATATLLRSAWGALVVCVLWSGLTMVITAADPGGLRALARSEGCAASPAIFIAAVALLCGAMILYTTRKR